MAKKKRFSTRRSRVTLSIVCIVVIAVVAFFVYRAFSGDDTATVTYTTGTVQKMTLTSSVSGTGNIDLPNTESVNPSISGKVADLSVKLGDTVKKGDVLFTLYNPQLDVDVANAQNAYDKAVLGRRSGQDEPRLRQDQPGQHVPIHRGRGIRPAGDGGGHHRDTRGRGGRDRGQVGGDRPSGRRRTTRPPGP